MRSGVNLGHKNCFGMWRGTMRSTELSALLPLIPLVSLHSLCMRCTSGLKNEYSGNEIGQLITAICPTSSDNGRAKARQSDHFG